MRRLRGMRGSDRGFTLAEMLAVMSILAVISSLAFGALMQSQKTVRGNANRLDQVQQAKAAIETMTKTVRTAVLPSQIGGGNTDLSAFLSADWNRVSFYANIYNPANVNGPSKVSYVLSANGDLTESVQAPSGVDASGAYTYCVVGPPSCVVKTRIVARKVVYSSAKPLFVYYSVAQPAGMAVPLTATTLPDVNSVDISLSVRTGSQVPASTVVTRVSLPNANARINNNPANT
jgi:prepilin-type N-terminal cleavage/methylation domain-containing protein